MKYRLLAASALLISLSSAAVGQVRAAPVAGGTAPIISDERPYNFSVSWTTSTPVTGRVQAQIDGKWQSIPDIQGAVKSTTHLFDVPCNSQTNRGCKQTLKPNTGYAVRVFGAGSGVKTLHAHTTPTLSPVQAWFGASVAGHVLGKGRKPFKSALVYAVVHDGKASSVPMATLSLPNGGWLFALANAVTPSGKVFPLRVGETVRISVQTGLGVAGTTVHLKTLQQPTIVKKALTVH